MRETRQPTYLDLVTELEAASLIIEQLEQLRRGARLERSFTLRATTRAATLARAREELARGEAGERIRASACTSCGLTVSRTPDGQLYSWPDGQQLCWECNDKRQRL